MLKIFVKKLTERTLIPFWKQLGGLAIGLKTKYWDDPFFKAEFNVIIMQIAYAIVLLLFIGLVFNYFYENISTALIEGILQSVQSGGSITGKEVLAKVEEVKKRDFILVIISIVSITILFSYLIARMTMTPAKNALKSQKRFVGDLAHELRTPLAIIKTNSEVAMFEENLSPKFKKVFKSNIEELDRIGDIINNLLTFGNLMHPGRIKFGSVDLSVVVNTAIEKLQSLTQGKKILITVEKVSPYNVLGNSTALEQIVINLLKNAINYSKDGGKIKVHIEPDYRGSIVMEVTDTGIGISPKDLPHIFEPFYRADKSRSRSIGSSGLGLPIVADLIKLHSGRINIKSQLKIGTKVTVILPQIRDLKKDDNLSLKDNNEIGINFMKS